MAELVTANQPFQGVDGKPIVNGFIFVGKAKSDTILNPLNIFSDRELTVALDNPQRTNTFGRPVNKIWGLGKYSVLVQDVNNVQKFTDDDTGESESGGLISLTNVQGLNSITAEGVPTISNYIDKALYIFTTAGINTGNITLNIDSKGAKSVKIQRDLELSPGNFQGNQIVQVAFNAVADIFEIVSNVAKDELGIIKAFSGAIAAIPNGFQICDGTNGTPDLRNSFIIGAGSTHTPLSTGGSIATGGHALTVAELAPHTHTFNQGSLIQKTNDDNGIAVASAFFSNTTGSTGSGTAHIHANSLPPFVALAWIQRV